MSQPPQEPQPAGQQPPSAQEEQTISIVVHIAGLFTSFIVPLVLWLVYRERSQMIGEHSKAALNWQLLILIGYILVVVVTLMPIPFLGAALQFGFFILNAIFCVLSAIAASQRQAPRYPVDTQWVK